MRSRQDGTGRTERGRWFRSHQRWSLRTRLVVSAVTLIAVVCAVIGTVTTIALRSSLNARLDDELGASVARSHGATDGPIARQLPPDDTRFAAMPGQPIGTVGARTDRKGTLIAAARSNDAHLGPTSDPADRLTRLTPGQLKALKGVPPDDHPHTVTLPGLGDYRVQSGVGPSHDRRNRHDHGEGPSPGAPDGHKASGDHRDRGGLLVGLPMGETQSTLGTIIVVEICVTAAALVAAGIAGAAMVRIALRPLRRVAATATRVSELQLHSGEVTMPHRVPVADTDARTEVGQVGAALNRMLGHVGSALAARQESETRVRQFVADASHELRTPLASIRGYAELTRRAGAVGAGALGAGAVGAGDATPRPDGTGSDARYALTRIEAEATRMTGLVEDLLLLARLDAGRPLETAEVDLSPLVVDALSDARAAGPAHVWRLEVPAEPVDVRGDRARLQQVLVNLLANARTHTPDGTAVTARVRPAADGSVVVEVEDDGPGIPHGVLPHIFERFARGDAARSRARGSTGLGLAIVQAVVTAHGGQVSVESAPGRTVFAVRLPAAPQVCGPGDDRPGNTPDRGHAQGSQPAHRFSTRS